ILRVFQKAVVIDAEHKPNFVTGDFNGDGSQDIAVVVRPADGMLSEINSEVANWILENPQKVAPSTSASARRLPSPVYVEKGDVLLAIIHGYGPEGWRNKSARQTYLLKSAVGSNMKSQTVKDLLASIKDKNKPALQGGDVLNQTLGAEQGILFW